MVSRLHEVPRSEKLKLAEGRQTHGNQNSQRQSNNHRNDDDQTQKARDYDARRRHRGHREPHHRPNGVGSTKDLRGKAEDRQYVLVVRMASYSIGDLVGAYYWWGKAEGLAE